MYFKVCANQNENISVKQNIELNVFCIFYVSNPYHMKLKIENISAVILYNVQYVVIFPRKEKLLFVNYG